MTRIQVFDKYKYYSESVQSPEADAEILTKTYMELRGKTPEILSEDFCGTFKICCEWIKLSPDNRAIGIDLDPEPISYGRTHYLPELTAEQQSRLQIIEGDVLAEGYPKADIIAALNFSYFIFKKRSELKAYIESCYRRLKDDGILIFDCFGGSETQEANVNETEHDDFSYFWDQDSFNPINHHAQFYIHFKRPHEKKREKVFSYDWRMWTLAELRDLFEEVGFKKSHVYWEGTDEDGDGNGEFERTEEGEECESWVAYLAAEK